MLSERNLTKGQILYNSIYMKHSKQANLLREEVDRWWSRARGGEECRGLLRGAGLLPEVRKGFKCGHWGASTTAETERHHTAHFK